MFIDVGQRLGAERFYDYFQQFGLLGKTGIDLPGEAATIMHKKENMGLVELATVSFGQSFQITPIQLVTTASSIINGGNRITPHFAIKAESRDGSLVREFTYPVRENVVSEETSRTMRHILEQVVAEGSGKRAKVDGFRIGGKRPPRKSFPGAGKSISLLFWALPRLTIPRSLPSSPLTNRWGSTTAEPSQPRSLPTFLRTSFLILGFCLEMKRSVQPCVVLSALSGQEELGVCPMKIRTENKEMVFSH